MEETVNWPPEIAIPYEDNGSNSDILQALRSFLDDDDISPLDRLAMHRAALWLIQADGYGMSANDIERKKILGDATSAAMASRSVIQRLVKLMHPPQFESHAIASSEAGWRLFEADWL